MLYKQNDTFWARFTKCQNNMFKAIIQIVLIGVFSFRDDFKKLGCFLNTGAVTLFQYFSMTKY